MPLLTKNKLFNSRCGQSLSMWVAVLAVLSMGWLFTQKIVSRSLRAKVAASADYCFWGRWGQDTQQYKGDDSVVTKSVSQNKQDTQLTETSSPRNISFSSSVGNTEHSLSVAVGEDFRSALRAYSVDNHALPAKKDLGDEVDALRNNLSSDVNDKLGG
ncbi:MAG: hypothetical protein HY761_06765 [Candidatus Omnitrophica bacterium]|nr:hypothetical protein [Candidatus Omnitrophota bacterium]